MVEETRASVVGERFAEYLIALREFFTSRGVAFGAPRDILALSEKIDTSRPFAEEMGSMVRSILFLEGGAIGTAELLEIVIVAVGGPEAEGAASDVQGAVRKIFSFLHQSVLDTRGVPEEAKMEEESTTSDDRLTAGDILAAGAERQRTEDRREEHPVSQSVELAWPSRQPELLGGEGLYARAARREQSRERVFTALPAAAVTQSKVTQEGERSMAQGWLVPALAAGLAVIGIGAYVARPAFSHHQPNTPALAGPDAGVRGADAAGSCAAPMQAGVTRDQVEQRARWAHNLMDQKLYDAALPQLREIARIDPGFPGIQLEQADSLVNLKRPDEARAAVDNQIALSECLARLPQPQLDAYCATQFGEGQGCRTQLTHIQQAAQLQAALIHLELGHRIDPESTPTPLGAAPNAASPASVAAVRTPAAAKFSSHPTARAHSPAPQTTTVDGESAEPTTARRSATVSRTAPDRRLAGEDSLRKGEGTDSAFGAYQKPQ